MGHQYFLLTLLISNIAHATAAAAATAGATVVSYSPAAAIVTSGAGVATVGIINDSWWGTLVGGVVAVGGVVVAIGDPAAATFFDGEFEYHYPGDLLTPMEYGWLGDWGDLSIAAPPADPSDWSNDISNPTIVDMQNANPLLTTTFSQGIGKQTIGFDWGPQGHQAISDEPFNFSASTFVANQDLRFDYLGEHSSTPPSGANFYMSVTSDFKCIINPPEETVCGDTLTSYYRVYRVPEPSTYSLIALGIIMAFRRGVASS